MLGFEPKVGKEKDPQEANYFREALFNGYNLALLGASLALGLLNWDLLPLVAGIAVPLEALYLLTVPDQGWFQRWINLQHSLEKQKQAAELKDKVLASFAPEVRDRYLRLQRMKAEIADHCRGSDTACPLNPEDLSKLESYLDSFVYFIQFRAQCLATKLSIDMEENRQRIQRLEKEMEADQGNPDRQQVNILRAENIKMNQEILDRVRRLDSYIAMVDAQTEAIENTIRLIQVRLATSNFQAEGEVELVSSDINHLLDGIHDTEKNLEEASKDMVKIKKLSRLSLSP